MIENLSITMIFRLKPNGRNECIVQQEIMVQCRNNVHVGQIDFFTFSSQLDHRILNKWI